MISIKFSIEILENLTGKLNTTTVHLKRQNLQLQYKQKQVIERKERKKKTRN